MAVATMGHRITTHQEVCPLPDIEHALKIRARASRPCKHRFNDGKTAWRRRNFQIDGHPAEAARCALCRIQIVVYYEED